MPAGQSTPFPNQTSGPVPIISPTTNMTPQGTQAPTPPPTTLFGSPASGAGKTGGSAPTGMGGKTGGNLSSTGSALAPFMSELGKIGL